MPMISARWAARLGHADCLQALLRCDLGFLDVRDLHLTAMHRGQLACLQVLLRYVFPTDVLRTRMPEHITRMPRRVLGFPHLLILGVLWVVAIASLLLPYFFQLKWGTDQSMAECSYRIDAHGSHPCASCRESFHNWREAALETTGRGFDIPLPCLRYLVDLGLRIGEDRSHQGLMACAAAGGSLEALKLMHEAGCEWTGGVPHVVARSGNPDALRYALDHTEPDDWDSVMMAAVRWGSLECVKVLYDKGYPHSADFPAEYVARQRQLEILRFVVDLCGPPQAEVLSCVDAVYAGAEMLQYVRELGCVFTVETTEIAAHRGDLEALQYAHMSGAPWGVTTLENAVWGNSLPCLEYAHTHGCPHEPLQDAASFMLEAQSLPVLRYVNEHMGPTWAAGVLNSTARAHARLGIEQRKPTMDWQLMLYLGKKLGVEAFARSCCAGGDDAKGTGRRACGRFLEGGETEICRGEGVAS
jgi:Ankyrin repeats (3 copies)